MRKCAGKDADQQNQPPRFLKRIYERKPVRIQTTKCTTDAAIAAKVFFQEGLAAGELIVLVNFDVWIVWIEAMNYEHNWQENIRV